MEREGDNRFAFQNREKKAGSSGFKEPQGYNINFNKKRGHGSSIFQVLYPSKGGEDGLHPGERRIPILRFRGKRGTVRRIGPGKPDSSGVYFLGGMVQRLRRQIETFWGGCLYRGIFNNFARQVERGGSRCRTPRRGVYALKEDSTL